MKKIAVRTCGQPQRPRFYLQDDGGCVWTGESWSQDRRSALLFADWNEASHAYRRLEEAQWSSSVPARDFEAVIRLRVWSGQDYTVEALQDYLHQAIRILLDHDAHGTGPVPGSLVRIDIDWGKLTEARERDQR